MLLETDDLYHISDALDVLYDSMAYHKRRLALLPTSVTYKVACGPKRAFGADIVEGFRSPLQNHMTWAIVLPLRMHAFSQLGSSLLSSSEQVLFIYFRKIVTDDKKMIIMIFH